MCVQSIFADNVYFIFKMDEIVAAIEMDVRYSLSVRIVLNGLYHKCVAAALSEGVATVV